jgi:uncharacterized protein (DUF3084 family)
LRCSAPAILFFHCISTNILQLCCFPSTSKIKLTIVISELTTVKSELTMVKSELAMVKNELTTVKSELAMVKFELAMAKTELTMAESKPRLSKKLCKRDYIVLYKDISSIYQRRYTLLQLVPILLISPSQ